MAEEQNKRVVGSADKRVPKYTNGVMLTSDGRRVILTHTYTDEENPDEIVVIERIALDIDHVKQLSEMLAGFIAEATASADSEVKQLAEGGASDEPDND